MPGLLEINRICSSKPVPVDETGSWAMNEDSWCDQNYTQLYFDRLFRSKLGRSQKGGASREDAPPLFYPAD
jgi:hypothetical protein